MLHRFSTLVVLLVLSMLVAAPATAEKRMALVIGNADYLKLQPMKTPVNNAKLLAKSLANAGFEVVERENLNFKDMRAALNDFARQLEDAAPDTVGLVYFAGHGIGLQGQEFLAPVDGNVQEPEQIEGQLVSMNEVVTALKSSKLKMRFVFVDASRNSPFQPGARLASGSVSSADDTDNIVLMFATGQGNVAIDGPDDTSPFTTALAAGIAAKGLEMKHLFGQIRDDVSRATPHRQSPFVFMSFDGEFYFTPPN